MPMWTNMTKFARGLGKQDIEGRLSLSAGMNFSKLCNPLAYKFGSKKVLQMHFLRGVKKFKKFMFLRLFSYAKRVDYKKLS